MVCGRVACKVPGRAERAVGGSRCIGALVTMGVLIPGPDMTAVRRTAAFFLNNFQDRLEEQKRDAAANPDYDASFKGPRSKEDKKAVRKQILSTIGAGSLGFWLCRPTRAAPLWDAPSLGSRRFIHVAGVQILGRADRTPPLAFCLPGDQAPHRFFGAVACMDGPGASRGGMGAATLPLLFGDSSRPVRRLTPAGSCGELAARGAPEAFQQAPQPMQRGST